jgi:hypothetical protein
MALLTRSLEVIALRKIMAKELQVKNQEIRVFFSRFQKDLDACIQVT